MKNYSEMSDFEINKSVALAVGYQLSSDFQSLLDEFSPGCVNVIIEGSQSTFNPCNSWADAGPIIEKYRIGIENDGDCWLCACFSEHGGFESEHDNPLRAAMIVFLMMQEGE